VDGSKFPSLPDDVGAATGLDAGLVVVGVRQPAIPPTAFTTSSTTMVVYCGDVEHVGEALSSRCARWDSSPIFRNVVLATQTTRRTDMRTMLWIGASLLAVLFANGAMAQEIDWKKVEFGIATSFAGPAHVASNAATGPAVISVAAPPDTVANATGRSRETLRGVVASVDERNDRISVRLAPDTTAELKVRDGLLFNAVRYGDQVEVTVENIDGAKTIVGLVKE
jgi:hypothetical protein